MIGALASHLWQSTIFALVAAVLTLAFRNNRANVRYWLWLSASLKFLVPFAVLVSLGSRLVWVAAPERIATPDVTQFAERIVQPFVTPAPSAPAPAAAPVPTAGDWMPAAALAIWGCGFAVITLMRLRLWLRIQAAVRASTPLDIRAAVEIRSSSSVIEPGVVGWLHPVLLLPEGIVERLAPAQFEAVLAHELCHVRRRDNLFSTLHMIVEAAFWFHPLVWWVGARLIEERERACDEGVLDLGNEPRTYADAILNVCKLYVEAPLPCVSGVTGGDLKRRLKRILANRAIHSLNRTRKFLLAVVGVIALAAPVSLGLLIGLGHLPPLRAQVAMGQHLIAMLFDFDGMTPDQQAHARQAALDFMHKMQPEDRVALLVPNGEGVKAIQDFTSDQAILESTIEKLDTSPSASATTASQLSRLGSAVDLLSVLPADKLLMYFSGSITWAPRLGSAQSEPRIDGDRFRKVMRTARQSNLAFYPVGGNSGVVRALSSNLNGGFSEGMGINWPPPVATFAATPRGPLVSAGREPLVDNPAPTDLLPGLPGRHASIATHAAGEVQTMLVPLDSLTGEIGIAAQIRAVPPPGAPALVGRRVPSAGSYTTISTAQYPSGVYQASFLLPAGSYICALSVKESATGQNYGETIHFDVIGTSEPGPQIAPSGNATAPAEEPLPPGRIRVAADVQEQRLISKLAPVYPTLAKQARIQGTVRFQAVIAKNGTVEAVQTLSGHPLLVPAAMDAVKQWVYQPTLLNGESVEVQTQIDVTFTLAQ